MEQVGLVDYKYVIQQYNQQELDPETPEYHFQMLKNRLYSQLCDSLTPDDILRINQTKAFVCIVAKGDEEGENLRTTLKNFQNQWHITKDSNGDIEIKPYPFELAVFVNTPPGKEDITSQYAEDFPGSNIHLISHTWTEEDVIQFRQNGAKIISSARNICVGATTFLANFLIKKMIAL